MIGEPRQTAGPPSCHPRPLVIVCPTQHTSLRRRIMFGRLGVVIPPSPRNYTEGFGDLTPVSPLRAHRYPIVKKLAIKKPDPNTRERAQIM